MYAGLQNILCIFTCTTFSLLKLIFVLELSVQRVILIVAFSCNSLNFHCFIIFHSVNIYLFIYSFLHQKHLGLFQIDCFPVVESSAINILQVSKCLQLNYKLYLLNNNFTHTPLPVLSAPGNSTFCHYEINYSK